MRSGLWTLLMLCIGVPPVSLHAQYAPQWHVGDWWVTKTLSPSTSAWRLRANDWSWQRYDILSMERVGGRNCYVLQIQGINPGRQTGTFRVGWRFHVREDDWKVVRETDIFVRREPVLDTLTTDYPLGLFGPFWGGEPRLPVFPLEPGRADTSFRFQWRAYLRELSGLAESAMVESLLSAGDTSLGRVLRPAGVVYQVRSELGSAPGLNPAGVTQSLQLWGVGQPWRFYEAMALFDRSIGTLVEEQSWLIASGRGGR